jgi:hypothetical protein
MRYEDFDTLIEYRIDETKDSTAFCLGARDHQILSKNVTIEYGDIYLRIKGLGVDIMYPRKVMVSLSVSMKENENNS